VTGETVVALLRDARKALAAAGIDTAGLDARILLARALDISPSQLIAAAEIAVPEATVAVFNGWIARRLLGEPVGRILGERAFRGLELSLGPDVLEPRPDTEVLVERALELIRNGRLPNVAPDGDGLAFADLGTGSGAVGLGILESLPLGRAILTDISLDALEVAKINAARAGLSDRVEFYQGCWTDPLPAALPLIVCNPPYIARKAIDRLDVSVRGYDPHRALDGGEDGLDAYRAILSGLDRVLCPGGVLIVEIGHDQGEAVVSLFTGSGLQDIRITRDFSRLDRVVEGWRACPDRKFSEFPGSGQKQLGNDMQSD
jgi:release factor glutamine methyltransferase